MNQSSFLFIIKIVIAGAIILAILLGALVFSGVVKLKNGWIPVFPGNDPISLLERKVVIPEHFSEEASSIALKNIESVRELIRANPKNTEAWLDLAIYYKVVGDLDGSVEIWQYLVDDTQNTVALQNLANTYHLDLKKYEESEEYYLKVIGLEPQNSSAYLGLHELYRYSYKQDGNAAVDILKTGLEKVNEQEKINIFLALGSYYGEKSNKELAVSAYEDARAIAKRLGNTALVQQIDGGLRLLQK